MVSKICIFFIFLILKPTAGSGGSSPGPPMRRPPLQTLPWWPRFRPAPEKFRKCAKALYKLWDWQTNIDGWLVSIWDCCFYMLVCPACYFTHLRVPAYEWCFGLLFCLWHCYNKPPANTGFKRWWRFSFELLGAWA